MGDTLVMLNATAETEALQRTPMRQSLTVLLVYLELRAAPCPRDRRSKSRGDRM